MVFAARPSSPSASGTTSARIALMAHLLPALLILGDRDRRDPVPPAARLS
jgi:hypothetical protein